MHWEQRNVPLWRWAVAACLAATMVTVVWLFTFDRQADGPIVAQATLPQPLPEQQPETVAEPATVVESSTPVITKRHRPYSAARVSTLSPKPAETAKADPTADVVAAEPVSPLAEEPLPAVAVNDEPIVVIHHEIYVVADTEPVTVEEGTATDEPESGIEGILAFGRSLGARLRAERLRIQGETRVALASL